MELKQEEFLHGEYVILERRANLLINPKDYGLGRMKYNLQRKEAVGGKMYVTNYRLLFKPHLINRVKGLHSILLHNIQNARDSSFLFMRKMEVTANNLSYEFVVGKREELMRTIETAKRNITPQQKIELERQMHERTGGLDKFDTMDKAIKIFFNLI
ncbi:hypothetical protein SAMN05443252_11413 [Bacillus sp. OV322]|uniref:hypothetical protein n=1 Tax=Bacillus sp. OV322 TaxID=1882764 RepID=UPI0008E4F71A|nr:hypothetical protein [Bacillus sp. OV322]SFD02238.1 hypothetical protein SAMN05443252_11413 [Bacillus sp. OV322]